MPTAFIIFIVVPLLELWLLITVGRQIGPMPTVALVIATALVGVALLRQQGFATLQRLNQRVAAGELPAREMVDGLVLAIGGALLLTPGFMTDALGFICLLPGLRHWLLGRLLAQWQAKMMASQRASWGEQRSESGSQHTIDGEYRRDD